MTEFSRRRLLQLAPATLLAQSAQPPIDRRAVVSRHNPTARAFDPRSALSVGNGGFAFTADPTGLQTFPALYEKQMPLCTMSQWGWHTTPDKPAGVLRLEQFDTFGRKVGYPTSSAGQEPLFDWLRENPHRLHLGRIGFAIDNPQEVTLAGQTLDLWTGILHSEFEWKGRHVAVDTCCHPEIDLLAVTVRGSLPVRFEFPYGASGMSGADWDQPGRHKTFEITRSESRLELARMLDSDKYTVAVGWDTPAAATRDGEHRFLLTPSEDTLEFVCAFLPAGGIPTSLPAAPRAMEICRRSWERFWTTGGAVDLGIARELERRVVLSQYLTATQSAQALPPAETGLTCNSWYGKFHLEMHYWHAAHFAVWGRAPLLERSLAWYTRVLPSARQKASSQGYSGARWPKMTAPDGRDSPSPIGPLLIWQQPHIITMAELCYRAATAARKTPTLARYRELVFASADFMASYAHWDPAGKRYVLGPPVIPAQENHPPRETWNPTFELEYWACALETAQLWRERLGLARDPQWEEVRTSLAALPSKDGVYLAHENCPQTFSARNRDHPSFLYALGVLPGGKVDRETMARTLDKVRREWEWTETWGWDFPAVAMTAASLGQPEAAADILLMQTPKNTWLPNGHNWQRANLPLYLPGNGGLLLAIAHIANTCGFPKAWHARWEQLAPLY